MTRRGRFAVVVATAAVLFAVAVVVFLTWERFHPPARSSERAAQPSAPTPTPEHVVVPSVTVTSPDLRVRIGNLYVAPERDGTWWDFTVVCQELRGCRGELEFDIAYLAGGRTGHTLHRRAIDLPSLGQKRIRFVEQPRHKVDSVEGISVRLVERAKPDTAPAPPRRIGY